MSIPEISTLKMSTSQNINSQNIKEGGREDGGIKGWKERWREEGKEEVGEVRGRKGCLCVWLTCATASWNGAEGDSCRRWQQFTMWSSRVEPTAAERTQTHASSLPHHLPSFSLFSSLHPLHFHIFLLPSSPPPPFFRNSFPFPSHSLPPPPPLLPLTPSPSLICLPSSIIIITLAARDSLADSTALLSSLAFSANTPLTLSSCARRL